MHRGEERAEVDTARRVVGEVGRAAQLADRVQDDRDEGRDHRGERGGHDEGHRELDQVAPQDELFEALHRMMSFALDGVYGAP